MELMIKKQNTEKEPVDQELSAVMDMYCELVIVLSIES